MTIRLALVLLFVGFSFLSRSQSASLIHDLNSALTETMVHDGVNPPLSSRMYLYPNLGFITVYEHLSNNKKGLSSLLIDFPQLPEQNTEVNSAYVATLTYQGIAKSLLFRPLLFDSLTSGSVSNAFTVLDSDIRQASEQYVMRLHPLHCFTSVLLNDLLHRQHFEPLILMIYLTISNNSFQPGLLEILSSPSKLTNFSEILSLLLLIALAVF